MLNVHKHYLPILKTKAGERWALASLSATAKQAITPILELHGHRSRALGEHTGDICDDLTAIWGTDRRLFLDTRWVHGAQGGAESIAAAYKMVAHSDLKIVPVVRSGWDQASVEQLADIVADLGRGAMLRIRHTDIARPDRIADTLLALRIPTSSVDLLIDYRSNAMLSLAADISALPHLQEWRTLTAASGVCPRSLNEYDRNTWHSIDRADYVSWSSAVSQGNLARRPAFADYTVKDPGEPADFGAPSVALRYAQKDGWLVWIGGLVKEGASQDMHAVCASLASMPEYCGQGHCAGDRAIDDTANHILGSGNATQWLQWCINHHMELTSQQIASLPAL
jgi:hypothetical protein